MRFIPLKIQPLLLLNLLFITSTALGQAGSRPPVYFDSQSTFFYSGASIGANQSGQSISQAVFPDGIWQLPDSSRFLLWAELDAGRLSVLENRGDQGFVLRKRIPISIGKLGIGKQLEGDKKTPVGIYLFTSYLNDNSLDDYYGLGAYPLNYPNAMDKLAGKTGHGIWLHGLPKEVSERPLFDSDGCIIIDNASLLDLAKEINPGRTQIILSREPISWISAEQRRGPGDELLQALTQWQAAWESRDNARFLGYYANDFSDLQRNKSQWDVYKSRVNSAKQFIDVNISDVSMMRSPQMPDLVDVKFYQQYSSSDYQWQGWKHQLWRQEADGWKIVYEGSN